ncbi:MAG: hypothetical protein ACFB14_26500 [Leptolyngbyaceae cyanobacterium]
MGIADPRDNVGSQRSLNSNSSRAVHHLNQQSLEMRRELTA